ADLPTRVLGEAGSAAELRTLLDTHSPHALLLDVQMPGADGVSIAADLKARAARGEQVPHVIFVTAFAEHAVDAFELAAIDYLVKPVKTARLLEALRRVPVARESDVPSITVVERGRILRVPVAEVLYLKAEMKYVTIRTREREFLSEEPLTTLEANFPDHFMRIHRNALVSRNAIAGIERARPGTVQAGESDGERAWQVLLHGCDERLDVSRRQVAQVKDYLRT
ncbi:MAG TPA: LytTR family DNA-binding domain-containing protein, partial [Burkholderiaceae bacterium]|nr:LytTR family DNA-binding domain-containing protein [Burkholderiaceae bacterium]